MRITWIKFISIYIHQLSVQCIPNNNLDRWTSTATATTIKAVVCVVCVCVWACVRVSVCPYGHRIPERLNQICWGWLLYAQQCTNDIIPSLLLSLTLSLSLARFALATNTHPRHIGHTAHTTIQQNSNTQKWHRDKEKSSEAAYTNRNRLEFKRIKRREKRYLLRITGINNKMGESDFLYMLAAFLICVLFLTFVSCLESPHECM